MRFQTDSNHGEVKAALQAAGATVRDTARIGDGFPDLMVNWRGRVLFVEVKAPKARTKPETAQKQAQFARQFPTITVTSAAEAIAALGRVEA